MNTVIRPALPSDMETLVPLFDGYRQFYGRESDLQQVRAFLSARFHQGDSTLFLAEEAESGVGFTQLYPSFSSVSLARIFILNDLFVRESHRGSGVGRLLIAEAVDFARSAGAVRLSLSTGVDNAVAQSLYRGCGWKRDAQFAVYHYSI